ncbi:Orf243 (mitochondrion) [Monosiga brevicollis]|uniref:Orf243 n=1 Tax=Monosiga brevicollis TaxID=81824 RepID=Q8HIS6_MONBE|nr:Orf243 [Monosiga brevicollis]AAN28358.1 Orf243 [Monosiga brevicollis]|eukprot:NP_696987.1 Orf243 (mitochondrion) [Monosiga brevicollis ATCC 50154]
MSIENKRYLKDNKYLDWLAGITDGDGCFTISKKGYVSFELTVETSNLKCLYRIKTVFGGNIKPGKGKWHRYKLHHKEGIINIVNSLNGRLRNPVRILQLDKVCALYNIKLLDTPSLNYSSNWLSGFFDADGSIYINTTFVQVFISISQKDKYLLDQIAFVYGGKVYPHGTTNTFKWIVNKKIEVLAMTEYFKKFPLISKKMIRANLIPSIYEGYSRNWHKKRLNMVEEKKWKELLEKWSNYDI